jgi:polar amino acid transport system substrate-binding protein
MPGIGYQIRQQKIVDIKISGRLPQDWRLSVAVRNDQPMLKNIFQKLVNSISENQKNIITNNWMSVRYDQGFDYSLFWKILSIIFVLSLMVAYWSGKLRKLNKELNLANTKLRELSEKDELTNLYNRRYFSRSGLQTFSICQRSKIRFSIAIIDIDYFKSINDTKGHLFGDKCLQVIGEILHNHFQRQTDTLARFGGEEFAVFITGGGEDTLYQRLEHIRTELENTKVEMDGLSAVMTASAGVYSAMLTPEDTLDSVMKKADDALYQASGRNKVLIWENGKSSD